MILLNMAVLVLKNSQASFHQYTEIEIIAVMEYKG